METNGQIVRGPVNPGGQTPAWMYENTSFESKYSHDDDKTQEPFSPLPGRIISKHQRPQVRQIAPRKTTSCIDPTCEKTLKTLEAALETWISGDTFNVSEFQSVMVPFQNQSGEQHSFQELMDLEEILIQLSLELTNIFDNYLCFSGHQDESHMTRLFTMAHARASDNLESKRHLHASVTHSLLSLASDKLCQLFWQENLKIKENEGKITNVVAHEIQSVYNDAMLKQMMNPSLMPHHIQDIHQIMSQHLLHIMNQSLDFSAKMSHVQTTATSALKSELDKNMKTLQIKVANQSEQVPAPRVSSSGNKMRPLSSPPKTPLNLMQLCMLNYKKWMDKKWQNAASHDELERLHQEGANKATASWNGEQREILKHHIDLYFVHISELFEGSATSISNDKGRKCLFVHLGLEKVFLGVALNFKASPVVRGWTFDKTASCATVTFKLKKRWQEAIGNFLTSSRNLNKESKKLIKVVEFMKKEGEKVVAPLDKLLMVIPAWLSLEQRSALRRMAHEAGFRKAFLVSEASLAAYSLLSQGNDSSVVGISIGVSGIRIGIYARDIQAPDSVMMLATAVYEWDLEDIQKGPRGFWRKLVACSFYTSPGISVTGPIDSERILIASYAQAVNRVDGYDAHLGDRRCFIFPKSEHWLGAYESFSQASNLTQSMIETRDLLNVAMRLASQEGTQNIFKFIIDHPIASPVENEIGEDPVPPHPDDTSHLVMATVAAPMEPTTIIMGDTDGMRQSILAKCKQMRDEIERGHVRLGVLLSKLVGQSIEKAEAIGKDDDASLDQLIEENTKLVQVIKQHNFSTNENLYSTNQLQ